MEQVRVLSEIGFYATWGVCLLMSRLSFSFSTLLLRVLPRLRPEDLQEVRAQLNSDGTSATAAAAEPVVTLEAFKTCLGRLFGLKFHTSAPLGSRKDRYDLFYCTFLC